MCDVRSFLSALLAAALAGVMAACSGGGASPSPSFGTARPTMAPRSTGHVSSVRPTLAPPTDDAETPIRIRLSGAAPDAVVLDGTTAWVLAGEGGTLMQVDLAAGREVRSIGVGFGATHLALPLPGVGAVARFDSSDNGTFLPVVDLETGGVVGIETRALGGLAGGDDGVVWALEKAGQLLRVDIAKRAVAGRVPVGIGQNVHTEVQWGAGAAWVGSDGTPVTRIGADLQPGTTIRVDTGLPFLVRDGLVWGAGPEQMWAIDAGSNEVVRRVPLIDVFEVLALDVDGDDAWLAIRRPGPVGAVLRLDVGTGEVLEEHRVSLPSAVKIAPDRTWVASYLTNELVGFAR
jgi:hypothetical protein